MENNDNGSRVWIVNAYKDKDFSEARRFGETIAVTSGKINPFKIDVLIEQVKNKLKDYRSYDYLVPIGPPALNMVVASILFQKVSQLNLLLWNYNDGVYVKRTVHLKQIGKENFDGAEESEPEPGNEAIPEGHEISFELERERNGNRK